MFGKGDDLPMPGEVILEMEANGCTLRLLGNRRVGGDWQFRLQGKKRPWDTFGMEDGEVALSFYGQTGYVNSFQEALLLLDRFPWIHLDPLQVHPEFASAVRGAYELRAVEARRIPNFESCWRKILNLDPEGSWEVERFQFCYLFFGSPHPGRSPHTRGGKVLGRMSQPDNRFKEVRVAPGRFSLWPDCLAGGLRIWIKPASGVEQK